MKVLIIPSAVLIPSDMREKFGDIPTALFPLNEITMLEHLINKYSNIVDKIVIIAYKNSLLIEDYIRWKKMNIEIFVLDQLKDLGYSVQCGIEYVLKKHGTCQIIINFADTLLGDEIITDKDVIYYSEESGSNQWTFFSVVDGIIADVIDKDDQQEKNKDGKVFVGCFVVNDAYMFSQLLSEALGKADNTDSLYTAYMKYSQRTKILYRKTEKWFDVGHSQNLYKAKTGVEARAFNSIEIDEQRGILKKRSTDVDKFIGEINWYIKMPSKLQYLLPRIYDYSLDRENPYIDMECYGYHTLHELLIYGELPLIRWQNIFCKLLFIINDMEKFTVSAERLEIQQSLREMYIDKTIERLSKLRTEENFAAFFDNEIVINGEKYYSLNEYINYFKKLAEEELVQNYDDNFTIIHGDLCFANILIEENRNFLRAIDPRGKFGAYDIYGDSRYEIAKILHSLEGNYDYIIEDMFDIDVEGTVINYSIPEKSSEILEVFLEVFKDKLHHINQIRLIESSLFLSMVPLHSDHLERQYAMLATGILLLNKIIEQGEKNNGKG